MKLRGHVTFGGIFAGGERSKPGGVQSSLGILPSTTPIPFPAPWGDALVMVPSVTEYSLGGLMVRFSHSAFCQMGPLGLSTLYCHCYYLFGCFELLFLALHLGNHSWWCSGHIMGCRRLDPGWPCARQVPSLLCSHSDFSGL